MKRKFAAIIGILLFPILGAARAESELAKFPAEIRELGDHWWNTPWEADRHNLSQTQLPIMVDYLRYVANGNIGGVGTDGARAALIRLEDEEQLTSTLEAFKSYDTPAARSVVSLFDLSAAPYLIPYLAEYLYLDESANIVYIRRPGDEPILYPPQSVSGARAIARILVRAGEFSDETRQWARSVAKLSDIDLRPVMRQWWPQNKKAFEREDYAAVKPLAGTPAATVAPPADARPSELLQTATAVPSAVAQSSPERSPVAETHPDESKSPTWLLFVGVAGALCIGLWLFAARRR